MFTQICVGIVLIILICIATFIIGNVIEWLNESEGLVNFFSWLISSIGFGICLTIILYQNGIIR